MHFQSVEDIVIKREELIINDVHSDTHDSTDCEEVTDTMEINIKSEPIDYDDNAFKKDDDSASFSQVGSRSSTSVNEDTIAILEKMEEDSDTNEMMNRGRKRKFEFVDVKAEVFDSEPSSPPKSNDVSFKRRYGSKLLNSRRHKCSFFGCKKMKQNYPNHSFFSFPINKPSVCKEWVVNCANSLLMDLPEDKLKSKVVCQEHFTEDSFFSSMKNRLNKNAVPTIQTVIEDSRDQSSQKSQKYKIEPHNLKSESEERFEPVTEVKEVLIEEEHVSEIEDRFTEENHSQISQGTSTVKNELIYNTKLSSNTPYCSVIEENSHSVYRCDGCPRSYLWMRSLVRHQRLECGKSPQFPCSFCQYRAKHKPALVKHIAIRHKVIPSDHSE